MKKYAKKVLNIFLFLFIISIPIWLIISEATEGIKGDLIFYTGVVIIIMIIAIGIITNKF